MKFLIYLVVIFLLFNGLTANRAADSLIKKYCKNTSENSEPYFYNFCISSIKEIPESQNVKNSEELNVLCTSKAISNLTNVKAIAEKILKEKKYKNDLSKKLLQDCVKLYSECYKSLTSALKNFKARDDKKGKGYIDIARGAPRECEMGFNDDNQQKSPIQKENDVLFDLIAIPLFAS